MQKARSAQIDEAADAEGNRQFEQGQRDSCNRQGLTAIAAGGHQRHIQQPARHQQAQAHRQRRQHDARDKRDEQLMKSHETKTRPFHSYRRYRFEDGVFGIPFYYSGMPLLEV